MTLRLVQFDERDSPRVRLEKLRRLVQVLEDQLTQQASSIQQTIQGAADHADLTGRSAPNAHPISAITGLQAALDAKADASDLAELDNRVTVLEQGGDDVATPLIVEIDDTGASDPERLYIGRAAPGTATSDAAWQIQRIDLESDDDGSIRFADGGAFSQVWDNRLSLTYQ